MAKTIKARIEDAEQRADRIRPAPPGVDLSRLSVDEAATFRELYEKAAVGGAAVKHVIDYDQLAADLVELAREVDPR